MVSQHYSVPFSKRIIVCTWGIGNQRIGKNFLIHRNDGDECIK